MPGSKNSPADRPAARDEGGRGGPRPAGQPGGWGGPRPAGRDGSSREASASQAGQQPADGEASAGRAAAAGRAAYDRAMPPRLAAGTARDLVRAERDIRGRIGDQPLDFA